MAAAAPLEDIVLLGDTVVRRADIRRIDVSTQFGVIFNVYVQYGPSIRLQVSDNGFRWLYEQYLTAREAVKFPQSEEAEE